MKVHYIDVGNMSIKEAEIVIFGEEKSKKCRRFGYLVNACIIMAGISWFLVILGAII